MLMVCCRIEAFKLMTDYSDDGNVIVAQKLLKGLDEKSHAIKWEKGGREGGGGERRRRRMGRDVTVLQVDLLRMFEENPCGREARLCEDDSRSCGEDGAERSQ